MGSGNHRSDPETASFRDNKVPVKLEIEDPLEEEHGPLNKRCKTSPAPQEVCDLLGTQKSSEIEANFDEVVFMFFLIFNVEISRVKLLFGVRKGLE